MDKAVRIRIIRGDGRKFDIDGTYWRIPSGGLEGFGNFENEIASVDNAVGDGGVITSCRLAQKDRTIMAKSLNPRLNDVLRHEANDFFRAKADYKVYLTYMGITRWAEGKVYKYSLPAENVNRCMTLTVTFLFPNPYLKSYEDFGKDIAAVTGMIGFPYLCAASPGVPNGITGGTYDFARRVLLSNNGSAETYCRAVFVAKGSVTNPKLIIGDNFVRVIDTMQEGDVIEIDFVKNPPTVKKNGLNIMGKCDRKSTFDTMALRIGETEVQFDADDGTNLLAVSIYYNQLYETI